MMERKPESGNAEGTMKGNDPESLPTDFHRRKNEAERRRQMQALVESRKAGWREQGVLDDIPREAKPDYDQSLWRGKRWWDDKPWIRITANLFIIAAVLKIIWNVAVEMDAWSMAIWIPVLLFFVQLRLHIGRFGA